MKGEGVFSSRTIVVAAIVFILVVGGIIFAITNGLFGRQDAEDRASVLDSGVSRSVRMTIDGPIVGKENRESYRIEISASSREINAITGYDGTIANSEQFANTETAYTEFIHALARAGFDKVRTVSDSAADDRGVCATGKRYTFELMSSGRVIASAWTTSCSNSRGTFAGSVSNIKRLFDAQIPDRTKALSDISLR